MIREESARYLSTRPLHEIRTASGMRDMAGESGYFGFLWVEMNLPDPSELRKWTLKQMAQREMEVIEGILRRGLPSY